MLEVRGARLEEIDGAAVCIGQAFGRNETARIQGIAKQFKASLTIDTHFALENTRVAVVDGQVVTVVQIADRQMLFHGLSIRLGFINWVGTHPDHQRNGYGALVLWDTADYMAREGYDLSLIPGEGVEGFYERGGWRNFPHYYKTTLRLPDTFPAMDFGVAIRPVDWDHDLDAILAIFADYNRDVTGPAVRTREFWSAYASQWSFDYPMFYVATADEKTVAYLRNVGDRAIVEIGALSGAEQALLALIAHACQEARKAGKEEIEAITLPAVDTACEALRTYGLTWRQERVSGYLYRILRLPALLTKLLSRMQERSDDRATVDWTGCVQMESEIGNVWIEIQDNRLSVTESPSVLTPAIRVRLTQGQTIDLLFGQARLRNLLVNTTVARETALRVLETLCPPHEFRWYPKDAF